MGVGGWGRALHQVREVFCDKAPGLEEEALLERPEATGSAQASHLGRVYGGPASRGLQPTRGLCFLKGTKSWCEGHLVIYLQHIH